MLSELGTRPVVSSMGAQFVRNMTEQHFVLEVEAGKLSAVITCRELIRRPHMVVTILK